MKKTIVMTGGGTAGHVMANIALLPYLKDVEIHYIGSDKIEKDLMEKYPQVTYHTIHVGKLRRYPSKENVKDLFRVQGGYHEARRLLRKIKPALVFSKGGYVSVPVVTAAESLFIPVISHESDITPGLANKIGSRLATEVLTTFPETVKYFPEGKATCVGFPVRDSLKAGSRERGLSFTKLSGDKPVMLIMGGSQGSKNVNALVRRNLDKICEKFDIVHLCGKDNVDESLKNNAHYIQYEFINEELPDIFAISDIIISRAGSNAIGEFAVLCKPMLLIPLPLSASRGDQILNAKSFEERGLAMTLDEDTATDELFLSKINDLWANKDEFIKRLQENSAEDTIQLILHHINTLLNAKSKKNS